MSKWIIGAMAIAVIMVSGIAGCGAKLPTVSEDTQGDPVDQKIQVNTEYTTDGINVNNNVN